MTTPNWADIPARILPADDQAEPAPRDGKAFLGAWQFGGEWTGRVCIWDDYQKAFLILPGYHVAPITIWAPLIVPQGDI